MGSPPPRRLADKAVVSEDALEVVGRVRVHQQVDFVHATGGRPRIP